MAYGVFVSLALYWGAAALVAALYLRHQADGDPAQALTAASMRLVVPATLFVALMASLLLPNITEPLLGSDPHHPVGAGLRLHGAEGGLVHGVALTLLAGLILWAWLPPLLSWLRFSLLIRRLIRTGEQRKVGELVALRAAEIPRHTQAVIVPGAWIGLVGVVRPTLVVGDVLLRELRETELAAALAHEEAHRRGGHAWRRLLLLMVSRMLPVLGRRLLARWMQASERHCDLEASRAVGDTAWVASALLAVHRLQTVGTQEIQPLLAQECPSALGFASPGALAERVEHLLALPDSAPMVSQAPRSTRTDVATGG
jgi:Zn-dependent protease with chaperone function